MRTQWSCVSIVPRWTSRRSCTTESTASSHAEHGTTPTSTPTRTCYMYTYMYMYTCWRLQLVLHAAARLITGIRRYEHITPTLRDTLHWLPISQRITFKIALMMFDCSRGRCPKYFGDVYTPVHTVTARSGLRSADNGYLVVPRVRSTRVSCRSFRVCGPTIWNKLPQDLRSTDTREQFKLSLKSMRTAGGASDRRWLKMRRTNGLTYLRTRTCTRTRTRTCTRTRTRTCTRPSQCDNTQRVLLCANTRTFLWKSLTQSSV